MKNKLSDVRNHLVLMMELLADKEVDAQVIERARAVSQLASTYTETVKVELAGRKMLADHSATAMTLPAALEHTP